MVFSDGPFDRFIREPGERIGGGRSKVGSDRAALAASGPIFIELGEQAVKPNITRDGADVPILRFDEDRLGDYLAERNRVVTKVVSQNIAPGTVVAKGATVDIVLAQPSTIPIQVFDGAHLGLAEFNVEAVFQNFVAGRNDVQRVLTRNQSAATLNDTDRALITQVFVQQGITVDDQAGTDVDAAFDALQAARTFGG